MTSTGPAKLHDFFDLFFQRATKPHSHFQSGSFSTVKIKCMEYHGISWHLRSEGSITFHQFVWYVSLFFTFTNFNVHQSFTTHWSHIKTPRIVFSKIFRLPTSPLFEAALHSGQAPGIRTVDNIKHWRRWRFLVPCWGLSLVGLGPQYTVTMVQVQLLFRII